MKDYCTLNGIQQEFTATASSSQNGVSERMNLTLFNPIRTLLIHSGLDKQFWGEALMNVVHSRNRSPTFANPNDMTPHQRFFNNTPSIDYLAVFGQRAYRVTTDYERNQGAGCSKLSARVEECVFLGYSGKGYRLLTKDGSIKISRYEDTRFSSPMVFGFQNDYQEQVAVDEEDAAIENAVNDVQDAEQVQANADEPIGDPNPRPRDFNAPPLHEKRLHPAVDYKSQLNQVLSKPLSSLSSSIPQDTCITEVFVLDYCSSSLATRSFDGITPNTFEDIDKCIEKEKWRKATDAEIQSFMDHRTWELEPLPPGPKFVKGTWVFKIRRTPKVILRNTRHAIVLVVILKFWVSIISILMLLLHVRRL